MKGCSIMKEIYAKPISEIDEFKTYDIVATSNPGDDNDVVWGT